VKRKLGRRLAALSAAILLALMARGQRVSSAPISAGPADPARGKYIFQAYCVSCHGPNGRGDGPVAGSLQRDIGVPPTDLGSSGLQSRRSDAQLALAILEGGEGIHKSEYMPAWDAALTTEQVGDLVAFVRLLPSTSPPSPETSTPVFDHLDLGRYLYITRCLACHGPDGRGEGPFLEVMAEKGTPLVHPPNLGDYDEYMQARSDLNLTETISKGFAHSGWPTPQRGWWDRQLEDIEMRALIFYLRSLSIRPNQPFGGRS
jgi:cytochrome c oxidase cbb3-type subunit 3